MKNNPKYLNKTLRSIGFLLLTLVIMLSASSCNQLQGVLDSINGKTEESSTLPPRNPADSTGKPSSTTAPNTGDNTTATTNKPNTNQPAVTPPTILPAQDVKIIGFNLHNELETVADRADNAIYMLRSFMPDSIGVQECGSLWADALDEGLGDRYARVGCDVYGNEKGGFATYVYYLKDKYRVVATETFWLSQTPEVSSRYDSTVDMPRTCTWVLLENKQTGFRYVHVNTHLDRLNDYVESIQMDMIRQLMLRFYGMEYPAFATGDFNNPEGSEIYSQMLVDGLVRDSKFAAKKTMDLGTFSNYNINNAIHAAPIDFCFVAGKKTVVQEYKVLDHSYSRGQYVSDHFAVYVHATVKSMEKQLSEEYYIPDFKGSVSVTTQVSDSNPLYMNVTFPQARGQDGLLAHHYRVEAFDERGMLVASATASSRMHTLWQSKTVTCKLTGGVKNEAYTLMITPVSIFGDDGTAVTRRMTWAAESLTAIAPDAADILDLAIGDHVINDASPNHNEYTYFGNVSVQNGELIFTKNGNVKFHHFNQYYQALRDGFSMEAVVTTGADIISTQGYISNKDAGGFNLECSNGTLAFYLHNGESYSTIRAAVSPNTTYHVVCVYDGNMICLYLNGELVASESFGSYVLFPEDPENWYLSLGSDAGDENGEYFAEVKISAVRIYSNVLTYQNVYYLYQNQ